MVTLMPESWSRANCPNWDKVPISGQVLCMSMQGSNISEITEENIDEVSEYILHGELLENLSTHKLLSLNEIKQIVKDAIGFRRSWY
jgi:hypothetical protein